jgi:DNA-binding transcriptional MerR regulator
MALEQTTDGKQGSTLEELSEKLGVSKSMIRFWVEEFELNKPVDKTFGSLEVAELGLIHVLVGKEGLALSEAKKSFLLRRDQIEGKLKLIDRLEGVKKGLLSLKNKVE